MFFPKSIFSALLAATCVLTAKAQTNDVVVTADGGIEEVVQGARIVQRPGETKVTIHEGAFGDWKDKVEYKLRAYYACGAQIRNEKDQGAGEDDTAVNGLKLSFCHYLNWYSQEDEVVIYEGEWGDWLDIAMCPEKYYIIGAQIQYEDDLGIDGDDTAVNGLKIHCMNPETEEKEWVVVHEGEFGKWKEEVSEPGKLVYGAQVQFEDAVGIGKKEDDTAMNGLKFIFEDPNDGVTKQTPAGEWALIASAANLSYSMTTSMTWEEGNEVSEESSHTVSKHVEVGFSFRKGKGEAGVSRTGETSKSVANSMQTSFSQTVEETVNVVCQGGSGIKYLFQWQMSAKTDENGAGFESKSKHYRCTSTVDGPQCPLGFCKDDDCQECTNPEDK